MLSILQNILVAHFHCQVFYVFTSVSTLTNRHALIDRVKSRSERTVKSAWTPACMVDHSFRRSQIRKQFLHSSCAKRVSVRSRCCERHCCIPHFWGVDSIDVRKLVSRFLCVCVLLDLMPCPIPSGDPFMVRTREKGSAKASVKQNNQKHEFPPNALNEASYKNRNFLALAPCRVSSCKRTPKGRIHT